MANRRDNRVNLNAYQRGLLRLFRLGRWGYGSKTTAKLQKQSAESGESIFGLSSVLNVFSSYTQLSHDRRIKYADYDAMDDASPEIAGALSLMASECTGEDYHTKKVLWIESPDSALAKTLNRFLDRLSMEDRAWGTVRNLAKYGDCFLLNLFQENTEGKAFLQTVKWMHPTRVDRIEDLHLLGFKCPDLEGIVEPGNEEGVYRPWDFVHGRIMSYDSEDIYGRALIEEVRKIWKMLQILETMVAIAHIQRAIDRHIFYIDTTGLSDEEAMSLVKKFKTWLRKKDFFDPTTSQFKSDFNPVTIQEDLFWPTRENDVSKVDTLQGKDVPESLVKDLEYFRNKVCAGLGIPRDFLDGTTGGGAFDSKAALVLQDIHFARKMVRLQKSFKRMVRWLCEIHLFATTGGQVNRNFTVKMGSLSLVADIMNEDRWLKRAEVINQLAPLSDVMGWNKPAWSKYITTELLKDISQDVIRELLKGDDGQGVDPNLGKDADGDGETDEPAEPLKRPQRSPFLPTPKPDSISAKLFSSVDDDVMDQLREVFDDGKSSSNLKDMTEDFTRIKASIVKSYPELEKLSKRVDEMLAKETTSEGN